MNHEAVIVTTYITDHFMQMIYINNITNNIKIKQENVNRMIRLYDEKSKTNFINEVQNNIILSDIKETNNLNSKIKILTRIITESCNFKLPLQKLSNENTLDTIWFTAELHQLKRQKNKLYKKWKSKHLMQDELVYKRFYKLYKQKLK